MARVHYQGGIVDSLPLSASVMGAYDYWAYAVHALEGTIALPMADGDGDGVVNLIEYAIGGTPYSEDNPMLPRMQVDTGTQVIFNIDPERHDIVWSLERSFNASDYVEICRIDGSTGQKTMIEGIEVDVTDVTVTVDDHTVSAKTRAFYQLVVVR